MNKEFTYLHEISYWLLNKSDFTHSEYNLSGSRYSSKTYSIAEELAILIAISIKVNKSIAIYCLRKLNKDINELTKEIDKALINIGFDYKEYNLKYPNKQADFRFKGSKSFIRVMGVYSNSNDRIPLKGLSRSEIKGFDLAIEWCEEANEFSQAEFQAITFALGNAKKTIKIRSCNPDNIYQYFITYMNERVPFNLEIMKCNNEQIKSIEENQMFKLFHYSNWKVNSHNLKQDKINNLEELKILDPIKAQSWYYGVPSVLQGAIFARYIDKVNTELDFQVSKITGGLDIGMATSSSGHPTATSLWFIGENHNGRRAHKVSEFYHSNVTMQFKNTYELANNIIDYYLIEAQKYFAMFKGFTCYVDYGNGGQAFIDVLNVEKNKRNMNWLNFEPVDKSVMYLKDRIDFTTTGLIKNILSYDWNNCPETKRQYSLIQWLSKSKIENSNNEPKMLDLYDDTWDSDCYALMNDMKWLIEQINNELLINKTKFEFGKQYSFINNKEWDNMNYNPTEYFSIHEDTWELDIPRIIANKSTMLWLGKGLLFKSEDKYLLNFLNKLKDKDKWNEKLYQFGIQNSLLGKCFLIWMLTKNGELSLTLPIPSFMSRVAKFNEQEQSAELFFMNEQSDNGSLTWVTIENSKVKVEIFNGNREILLGSTKSKIKPESQLKQQYELKNPFGYLPIVEITNLPQIHFYGNSTQMNAYPDCAPVWNLIWDLQHIIKQKRKERILNLTRFYGIIDNEKFKALNLSDDFQSIIKDAFLNITTANYVKGGNGGVDIVQGNPKFGEYWLDYNGTAKQIFNGAGYDYDEFNGINYENKTKTLMNNKFDMQTTEVKITHYSTYLYRMFDMLVTSSKDENGKVYWNGKGERPYSFEFIPIAMVDQLVQDELINSRLNNGTMSIVEAISLYENIDTLMAKPKLENIINESKYLGEKNNDNEQRNENSINETSTSSIKANSTINKEM